MKMILRFGGKITLILVVIDQNIQARQMESQNNIKKIKGVVMEFLILVVGVIVALYVLNLSIIKKFRRNLRNDIERSIMKNYKPFTDEEKKRWQEIMKEIDDR